MTLTAKLILIEKYHRESTHFVKMRSKAFGDNGKCKDRKEIPAIEMIRDGATAWMSLSAGKTISLVLPPEYKVVLKK